MLTHQSTPRGPSRAVTVLKRASRSQTDRAQLKYTHCNSAAHSRKNTSAPRPRANLFAQLGAWVCQGTLKRDCCCQACSTPQLYNVELHICTMLMRGDPAWRLPAKPPASMSRCRSLHLNKSLTHTCLSRFMNLKPKKLMTRSTVPVIMRAAPM